ncbi:MAG: NADP-dependent phosphogluconate dehydrogenase [Pyrinomonadaceae bacterium]|nr:NADP-dependent phosphogluconate dehydrogenase [Pyrinomonadaceae bacterium]MDQ3135532.1 NADP-dependent phosphogluconate dehydrogenase [Acidobacteriota bacterium]
MSSTEQQNAPAQFGVIGLGVMGESLALNIEDHGFPVAVWNLEGDWVDRFVNEHGQGRQLTGTKTFEEFTRSLARPRRMLMMIKAGKPVDMTIERLQPLMEAGDILIDGGNSWFKDTQRREADMRAANLNFVGMGVSGGEEGARYGPSLMPGGSTEAYAHLRPILEGIAAQTDSGPCVTHVGPDGAGHFVKMVHNGIEYGDMQLIAEAYDLLRRALGMEAGELSEVFARWNAGPLESFLIEITSDIFKAKDQETGRPLVDLILDKAGQKGTGKWTAQIALELGVAVPTIGAALDARVLSSMKNERVQASKHIAGPTENRFDGDRQELIDAVHNALYSSKLCSYAQGLHLIATGSQEFNWNINLREMARIWKGGCIIRARVLDRMMHAYEQQPNLPNLLLDDELNDSIEEIQTGWRRAIATAQQLGIAVPAMSAALGYFDSYRTENLPQNLTQAQRDYFGAHTYERADKPDAGFVHTDWMTLTGAKKSEPTS